MPEQPRTDTAAWEGQMFRLLAENVLDYAIFLVDPTGRVLSWSKGAQRLFGYRPDEIIGQPADRLFTPEDRQADAPRKELEQARTTGRGQDDRWHVRKDGSRFWSSGTATPLRDRAGRLQGYAKVMRDRSELKQAEDVSRQRQRRLQLLTDQVPVLIAHCDADRRYTFVNKPYASRFGLHPREVVGRRIEDVLGERAYAAIAGHVQAALAGQPVQFEVEVPYDGQRPQVMRCAYDPEFDEAGGVRGFVAAIVNVTEARRAQQALDASRRRLQAVFDTALDAILLADDQGHYVDANPAACKLLGYPREELLRLTVADITPPPDGQAGLALWRAFIDAGEQAGEFAVVRRGGSTAVVEYRAVASILPGLHLSVLRDVTDRKRAEAELREADRRKDEFLATLAHELRNPLAPIRTAAEVLRVKGPADPALQAAREMIDRNVRQMVRLIDDLLDVSRITRNKLHLRTERLDLAVVVRSAVEIARSLIESRGHQLTVTLPPEPVWLEADPVRLAQVFANLLTNAAKYTDRGGHIWLTAEREDSRVAVLVRDTGIGIAAEHVPKLFEMFSQVAPALDRSQGGLGIGLSLVKGLVEMHGGSVEARSEGPGQGSTFTVRLPVADGPPSSEPSPPGGGQAPTRPKRRILVADDNHDAADSLSMVLRLGGHEVHAVHDGQEAVEAAAWFRPDVALLDIGMPRLNGFEVCRRIREQPWGGQVRLVAITGWGQEEDRRRAKRAGFDEHLTKPVAPADLERLLAAMQPK